jgi:hypothetical protein
LNNPYVAAVALKLSTTCSQAFPANHPSLTKKFDHAKGMLSRLTRIKTPRNRNPRIGAIGPCQNVFGPPPNSRIEGEIEPLGDEVAESGSLLVVGKAEYGAHASEPRRKNRRAEGIDHIVIMKRGPFLWSFILIIDVYLILG